MNLISVFQATKLWRGANAHASKEILTKVPNKNFQQQLSLTSSLLSSATVFITIAGEREVRQEKNLALLWYLILVFSFILLC